MKEQGNLAPIFTVIMAGGAGTRFWPKSRLENPKQFIKLLGEASLLQDTVERILHLTPVSHCLVLTDKQYAEQVQENLPHIPVENIVLEPCNRDTASCIGLAAVKLAKINPQAVMVVLPSDHYIGEEDKFLNILEMAVDYGAENQVLITLGIQPNEPKTGYGYICCGQELAVKKNISLYHADSFIEKPDLTRANQMLKSGQYLWNSGIFIWRVDVILAAIKKYLPEMYQHLNIIAQAMDTPEQQMVLEREYGLLPKISIDYGIMEKADNVVAIPSNFLWDDVGSWSALEKYLPKDKRNNTLNGGKHISIDTGNCIIDSEAKLIATIGVNDLIIIQYDDVMLVAKKDRDQEVKQLVEKLKESALEEYL